MNIQKLIITMAAILMSACSPLKSDQRYLIEKTGYVTVEYAPATLLDKIKAPLESPEAILEEIKPLIRSFPRKEYINSAIFLDFQMQTGTIVLRDGCFFLNTPSPDDPLILFHKEVGLGLDDEGYIVLINRNAVEKYFLKARVGEHTQWRPLGLADNDSDILDQLHKACGQHEVVAIGVPYPINRN